MTKSTKYGPTSTGVYARITGLPPTLPLRKMCMPTGSPRSSTGSRKRSLLGLGLEWVGVGVRVRVRVQVWVRAPAGVVVDVDPLLERELSPLLLVERNGLGRVGGLDEPALRAHWAAAQHCLHLFKPLVVRRLKRRAAARLWHRVHEPVQR